MDGAKGKVVSMKTYTIIGGINGAGKSSLSGVLKTQKNLGEIIDIDKIAQINNISNIEAGKTALKKINDYFENGITFTQETTLSANQPLKAVQTAKNNSYFIRLFYVGLDTADESIKRIANRVSKGGHNINSEDVERRFSKRFETLIKILPYCDEVIFFDNDNGFKEVAEYTNGELIYRTNYKPLWLTALSDKL